MTSVDKPTDTARHGARTKFGIARPNVLPIRGRDAELERGDSQLRSLLKGRGDVLVIEGPPGIGKTRLATELMTRARNAGVRTLHGQAFEYQQTVPFFPLFMATLHADPPIGDADVLRRLGESADVSYWVVRELQEAILAAAWQTPVMIVLEDVHWASNPTILALRTLTSTLSDAPVLWVLTARTGAGRPAVRDLLNELERRNGTVLRLPALPLSGVIDMVEDAVRARAEVSLLNMAAKAHGNPFLLIELLGGLTEEDRLQVRRGCAAVTGEALPQRLSTSMRQRLDVLTPAARAVVQVAAELPDRFSAALLAQMLERQPAGLVSAVNEAVRADLLVEEGDELGFRHDLLREATRQSLPRSLRRAVERQSATVRLQMGAAPEEVATQLARSADVGDREAIAALRRAAQSVANTDQSGAADLSKRALEMLPPEDSQRGSLLAETVGLLNRAARFDEAEALAMSMLSQLTPDDEALTRLRMPTAADAPEERVAANRRALELADISDVLRARHHAWLACNHVASGIDPEESVITQAVAAAEDTGDPEAQMICEMSLAILDYVEGYATRALWRIEKVELRSSGHDGTSVSVLAAIHRTNLLTFMGRVDEAAAVMTAEVETARGKGDDLALTLWALQGATNELAAGKLSAARASLEAIPRERWGVMTEIGMNRSLILAEVAARTGDRDLMQKTLVEARAANPVGPTLVNRGAAYILALAAWHCGDVYESVRWLSSETVQVLNPLWPNTFEQLVLTARVAVQASDAGLRARVLRSVELLERDSAVVGSFAAMVRHTRGILERDASALVDASVSLRACRPLLAASAAEDAAGELLHSGNRSQAIDQFTIAFDGYVELAATEDARRVRRTLGQLGVNRRIIVASPQKSGWNSLTDAELRVVNLISMGATNAAVAQRLHLSPHTVKSHVRNAFAKLGINSRSRLADVASQRGDITATPLNDVHRDEHRPLQRRAASSASSSSRLLQAAGG